MTTTESFKYASFLERNGYSDLHSIRLLCHEPDGFELMVTKYGMKDGHALKLIRHFCPAVHAEPLSGDEPQRGCFQAKSSESTPSWELGKQGCVGPQDDCSLS